MSLVSTKLKPVTDSHLRDIACTAGIRAFGMALGFLTTLLLARWLGVDGFGIYSYVAAWIAVSVALGAAGFERLLVRNVPAYLSTDRLDLLAGVLRWSGLWGLWIALAAGALTSLALAGRFSQSERLVDVASIVAIVTLTVVMRLRQSTIRGFGHAVRSQVPENVILAGAELAGLVGVAWLLHWRLNIGAVLCVYAVSACIAAIAASFYLKRTAPSNAAVPEFLPAEWRGAALALTAVVGVGMLIDQVDVVVLGLMRSAHDVSLYSAADKGAALVGFPVNAAQLALAPIFARQWASKDLRGLAETARRGALLTSTASAVIVALLLVPGPWFLSLFGPAFRGSCVILAILCAGQLVNAATGAVGSLLIMSNHESVVARVNGVCLILNVVLAIVLIGRWGAVGAAVATAVVMAVRNLVFAWIARRQLGGEAAV